MKLWVLIAIAGFAIIFIIFSTTQDSTSNTNSQTSPIPTATPAQFSEYTATFEIYTNGTRRTFTNPKYHNNSKEIYITAPDPSVIHVTIPNLTWQDFFDTLPMEVTKDCLTTGTGQTFCSNGQRLRFYINDVEDPNTLDKNIKKGDHLRIIFGSQ